MYSQNIENFPKIGKDGSKQFSSPYRRSTLVFSKPLRLTVVPLFKHQMLNWFGVKNAG